MNELKNAAMKTPNKPHRATRTGQLCAMNEEGSNGARIDRCAID
jgi:hypothetical protein